VPRQETGVDEQLSAIHRVFLACAVEALAIVLAAGIARSWRSAITGLLAGLLTVAVIVAALGPAVSAIPLNALRLVVGGLLLIFGLQWLRKAILRASGKLGSTRRSLVFEATLAAAQHSPTARSGGPVSDWYGFTLAFKGVVLEGLDVVFIVLTFGSNQHNVRLAARAALTAVLVVAAMGLAVRAPLPGSRKTA
jgi:uncharacterized membrane protein